nr:uncharacterized protein LOC128703400 [Cherax quadricarinatus]
MHGHGLFNWWGFSPPVDLINYIHSEGWCTGGDDVQVVMAGAGDPRHLLLTLARWRSNNSNCRLRVYVLEAQVEVYARLLLLMDASLQEGMGTRERSTLLLDLWANLYLRPNSRSYLELTARRLSISVTDAAQFPVLLGVISAGKLKYRERDAIEAVCRTWYTLTHTQYDPALCWDVRLRNLLKTRYDTRQGEADWAWYMRLSHRIQHLHLTPQGQGTAAAPQGQGTTAAPQGQGTAAAPQGQGTAAAPQGTPPGDGYVAVGSGWGHEFLKWRGSGHAFTVGTDAAPLLPNTSLASVVTVCEGMKKHRRLGYWGDLLTGPFPALALASNDSRISITHNGTSKYSGSEVAQWNLESLLEELWAPHHHVQEHHLVAEPRLLQEHHLVAEPRLLQEHHLVAEPRLLQEDHLVADPRLLQEDHLVAEPRLLQEHHLVAEPRLLQEDHLVAEPRLLQEDHLVAEPRLLQEDHLVTEPRLLQEHHLVRNEPRLEDVIKQVVITVESPQHLNETLVKGKSVNNNEPVKEKVGEKDMDTILVKMNNKNGERDLETDETEEIIINNNTSANGKKDNNNATFTLLNNTCQGTTKTNSQVSDTVETHQYSFSTNNNNETHSQTKNLHNIRNNGKENDSEERSGKKRVERRISACCSYLKLDGTQIILLSPTRLGNLTSLPEVEGGIDLVYLSVAMAHLLTPSLLETHLRPHTKLILEHAQMLPELTDDEVKEYERRMIMAASEAGWQSAGPHPLCHLRFQRT